MYISTKEDTSPEWTDKEVLALLEGIDMYREDWARVRDHVNTACHNGQHFRAQDDCILAFVRCDTSLCVLASSMQCVSLPRHFVVAFCIIPTPLRCPLRPGCRLRTPFWKRRRPPDPTIFHSPLRRTRWRPRWHFWPRLSRYALRCAAWHESFNGWRTSRPYS